MTHAYIWIMTIYQTTEIKHTITSTYIDNKIWKVKTVAVANK